MSSVQAMRWTLVAATAVCGVIAFSLGHAAAGAILLLGVALHTAHWYVREREPQTGA